MLSLKLWAPERTQAKLLTNELSDLVEASGDYRASSYFQKISLIIHRDNIASLQGTTKFSSF